MLKITIISIIFLALFFSLAITDDSGGYGGAFLKVGVSARILGMGGAFVGLSDDVSSIYWNPAGLSQLQNYHAEFMHAKMSIDRSYNFIAFCKGLGNYGTAGFGWINYSVSDIPSYDEYRNYLGTFSDSENAFLFSYSREINKRLSLGGSFKLYTNGLAGYKSSGKGFDIGTIYEVNEKYLVFGFSAQDIFASVKWNTISKREDPYPTTYRFGVKTETPFKPICVLFDLEKQNKVGLKYHLGAEYSYYLGSKTKLDFRGGINDSKYTFGASFNYSFGTYIIGLDYSYASDPLGAGNTHRFSLGIDFPEKLRVTPQPIHEELPIEVKPPLEEKPPVEEKPVPPSKIIIYPGGEHFVSSGDCLFIIAGKYYHDPFKWRLIYNANKDIISNPHWIYPDMKLVIPPYP